MSATPQFPATLDAQAKMISWAVAVALVLPVILFANAALHGRWEMLLLAAIAVVTLGVAWMLRPTGYTLDGYTLIVHRPAGPLRFEADPKAGASPVGKSDLGFGLRLFGSGGFGGYYGRFQFSKLGAARVFVTDLSKRLLLRSPAGKAIIISPDDTAAFTAAFTRLA